MLVKVKNAITKIMVAIGLLFMIWGIVYGGKAFPSGIELGECYAILKSYGPQIWIIAKREIIGIALIIVASIMDPNEGEICEED